MKAVIICPNCNIKCNILLSKKMEINMDILGQCPLCKKLIPVRLFKAKGKIW